MKTGIHPNYREVLFYDTSIQTGWVIRSTVETKQTMVWTDGREYPLFTVEVSSESHPFYTGKQRTVAAEGRIARFNARYGKTRPTHQEG